MIFFFHKGEVHASTTVKSVHRLKFVERASIFNMGKNPCCKKYFIHFNLIIQTLNSKENSRIIV